MKKLMFFALLLMGSAGSLRGQFFEDPMFFPGWNDKRTYSGGMKDLVSIRLGVGATHWDYRVNPFKWSANLDLNLYQKITIGMGVLGENDYYVAAGTHIFSSEGLQIESGIQRFQFSSNKGFSNNVYVNGKIQIKYPFYALVESSYSWNTNYQLMRSPWTISGRVGLLINLSATGFGGFGGFGGFE
jgi:hypothetical protein